MKIAWICKGDEKKMNKIIEFIKYTHLSSKILFILWLFFSVFTIFSSESRMLIVFDFTIAFLLPAIIIELCKNPVLHSGNSKFFAFMRSTKVISRILIYLWLFTGWTGAGSNPEDFKYTFPIMAIFFLLPAFLIEYYKNPILKRNLNRNIGKFADKNRTLIKYDTNSKRVQPCSTINQINFSKVKSNSDVSVKDKTYSTPAFHQKNASEIRNELSYNKEKRINGGKEKLQNWKKANGYGKQNKNESCSEQLPKNFAQSFEELKKEKIKPFGQIATLAEFYQVQVQGFLRVVRESLELLGKTTDPSTFFGRYETAVQNAKNARDLMEQYDTSDDAEELLESLVDEKESLVDDFIDRCYDKGILGKVKYEILRYRKHLTEDNISYMNDLLEDDEEDIQDEISQFSDVVISGAEEKTQSVPQRQNKTSESKTTIYPGITLTIKTDISKGSDDDFDFDDNSPYSSNKFIKDMAKFESKDGKEAVFVPFMHYWPSYDSMDNQQKDWYFYWRSQVRQRVYLKTDLSYIFVHVYELLSGYGWKSAQDGYEQMLALWTSYRTEHPRLDSYLLSWLFDFSQLHNLEFSVPNGMDISLPYQSAIRDILIDKHSEEKPLKLSFALIDSLCDYSLVGSKFYKDGHQLLMNEAIPRVVALADAALIKKTGKGILETYGPNHTKKQTYYAFQSANCIYANKRVDISVKGYTSSQKLRAYINELVRYAENILRELYGCRGRLRGVALEEETSKLVKAFLSKEYSSNKKDDVPPKKAKVKLDFDNIQELRNQSDAVRDALEVTDDIAKTKELLTDLDAVKEIFISMPSYCRALIDEMHSKFWEIAYNSSVQASIEKINGLSCIQLACAILAVEENTLILEDDYRDEFEYIYEHLHELDKLEVTVEKDDFSKFNLNTFSDEMKQLLETLSPIQEEILHIILTQEDINQRIEEIANAEMSMPEILIDEINDIATQCIGDILIDTFGDEMCILDQYVIEFKEGIK